MTNLQGCIRFWERVLFDFQFLMEPGTKATIILTIEFLKELQTRKGGE